MAKKPQKVVRYPRNSQRGLRAFIRNINIGKLIFLVIFIYMLFSVYTYWSREKIQPYEVTEGAIVNDRNYTGIILRKETTQYLDTSGYVNYYVREGRRVRLEPVSVLWMRREAWHSSWERWDRDSQCCRIRICQRLKNP